MRKQYGRQDMKRLWGFLLVAVTLMVMFLIVYIADKRFGSGVEPVAGKKAEFKAGFAREKITPPIGTPMTGFGSRDWDPAGCRGIHDDLYVRALYLSQGDREVLIMGFDLLFFSRDEADRFKGAIGRRLDLAPSRILLNTSHTHTGPKVGGWFYTPPDPFYLNRLESAIVNAALRAKGSAREATLWAGEGATDLPMSRRLKGADGKIEFRPNPSGVVNKALPVALLKDMSGKPVCLLFSVSCHPSTIKGDERSYLVSADYPGAAMAKLDDWLGSPASLFLQGTGGDAKASVIGKGEREWRAGSWEDVDRAGAIVADEVKTIAAGKLVSVEPDIRAAMLVMSWPLDKPLDRAGFEMVIKNPKTNKESSPEIMKLWAREQIGYLDRNQNLPSSAGVTLHGVHLGAGLRIVGVEGEAVGELGIIMRSCYRDGVTFALGYTDGAQMYLPTTAMLPEGGYEVESYWEYHQPAPLAGGMEKILTDSLVQLKTAGIN